MRRLKNFLLRKLTRFSEDDLAVISRVLGYAAPYKARIIGALVVGMLAGLLTAINLIAIIPVLTILFEDPTSYTERVIASQEKLAVLSTEAAQETRFFRWVDKRFEILQREIDISWKKWVREKQEDAIYIMAALLVVAQVIKNVLEFFSKYSLQKHFYLAITRIRTELYGRCLMLDVKQSTKYPSGDLLSRLNNDMRAVRQVFTTMVGDIVLAPFTVLSLLLVLFLLNWRMTLVVFIGVPIIVVPIAMLGKLLRRMGKKDEEEDSKLLGYTQETLQGLPVVKSFSAENREISRFRQLSKEIAKRQIRREKFRLYGDPLVEILASIAMAVVLGVGAYLVLKSSTAGMSPAAFLMYLGILTRFYPPIKRVSGTFVKLQKALANAERIFEVIDTRPEIVEKPNASVLEPFSRELTLEQVGFRYADYLPPVFDGFNLIIPKGRRIALVGGSGSGKSTLVRLVARLYDVQEGRILVDGVDIRDVTLESLRRQMAIVTQEPVLFNDTVFNNIAYARPDASAEEVRRAAEDAQAMEFIERLPAGFDTVVGERGGQLSGGQRQRLTIARALLANAPILILDEATSALDNVSEALVQRAIELAVQDRTVIMIAHRLSTVRQADEIVVIDQGKIVERGTHTELLSRVGKYRELVMTSFGMDKEKEESAAAAARELVLGGKEEEVVSRGGVEPPT